MKRKVQSIATKLSDSLQTWPTVECIAIGETAEEDQLSPYFSLILDVYYRDSIPDESERKKLFGDIGAFESSVSQEKDRFLLDHLPVHIEYKNMGKIEDLLRKPADLAIALKDIGTYMLYRLNEWNLLYERGDWIRAVRKDLTRLPDSFWDSLRGVYQQRMEHYLSDFGAAVYQGDLFFSLVSMSGFLKSTAATLFMVNNVFEPSNRFISQRVADLEQLPDSFMGRWDSFLRSNDKDSTERSFEIARLIAQSVVQL